MRILAAAVGVTLLQQVALGQTLTLEGPYWGDPTTWSGGQLPTSQEDVDATSTCGGNCVSLSIRTPAGAAVQAQARTVNATGRALTIGHGASLNVASLDSSSLTMLGATLTNRGIGPGFGVRPGVTTIQSNGALGASVFSGPGTFTLGNSTFVDGRLEQRGTGVLRNPVSGVVAIRNNQTDFDRTGSLGLVGEVSFINEGVIDIQGPADITNSPSPNTPGTLFANTEAATIQASDPLGLGLPAEIFPFVENSGRIAVSSGTLRLHGGGYHIGMPLQPVGSSAQLEASASGVLELRGNHQIGGAADGSPAAVVNVTGSGTVLLDGFAAPGTSLAVASNALLATSVGQFFQAAPMRVQDRGTVSNTGSFYVQDTLVLDPGSSFVHQGFMQISGTLENRGDVQITGVSQVAGQGSYLQLDGSTTVDAAAVLDLSSIPGQEGSFRQEGGTTTVDGLLRAGSVEFLSGTVSGSGTIEYVDTLTSAVTFGPGLTVQPGNSPGVLTINGNLEGAGVIFDIEVAGPGPGVLFDQLVVNGDANLTGATVSFRFLDGFLPTPGDTFNWLVVSGFASGLDTLAVSFFSDAGSIGGFLLGDGSLYVDSVTPVPLPPAAWGLGAALAALGGVARRRRTAGA